MSSRVVRRLRGMGVERMTAEDLASEAIARALTKQVTFESPEHVFNWTMVVARNLYVDQRRAASRAPEVCTLDDVDLPTADTATLAEHRMQLRRVLDALAGMSTDDRLAVMTDAAPASRKEAVRLNVRRHRARARLRAALAGVAALLGLRRLPRVTATAATPVALATALVTVWLPFVSPAVPDAGAARPPASVGSVPDVRDTVAARVSRPAPARRPARAARAAVRPAAPRAHRPKAAPERKREREQIAYADLGGGTFVDSYAEENGADEYLICLDSPQVGEACAGRPLGL